MKKLLTKYQPKLIWIYILSTPLFVWAVLAYRYIPKLEFQILVLSAIFYLMIAILSHYLDKTLSFGVVVEYVLIATLALIVLQSLLA